MFVLAYVAGVVCVLVSQMLLASAFMGVGLLIRRAFGLTTLALDDCFTAFWMGFAAVILALLLWHFVLPINVAMLILVMAVGALGLFISRGTLGAVLRDERWRSGRAWRLAFVVAALYVANQGLGSLTYSDTALYHLQAVEWNESYRLVPGLANLYGPLGFNNASLLYGAMLDVGPWGGLGHRLANGLLLQVVLLRVVIALARITRGPDTARSREVFVATFLPGVLTLSLLGRLSSYATATSTALVVLVVADQLYAMLSTKNESAREAAYSVFVITTLCAVAVTLKLSAVVFAAPATLLVLAVWLRRRSKEDALLVRTLAWTLGAALLIGGSWMSRSVTLSGYPLFPSRVAPIAVDWRTPEEHADAEYALAEHSAKASTMLNEVIAGRDRWGWIPRWFRISRRDPFDFLIPSGIALLALLVAVLRKRDEDALPRDRTPLWMLVPVGISVVAWFLLAPEGRYAIGFFWTLAALAVAEVWRSRAGRPTMRTRHVPLGAAIAAIVTLVTVPLLHIPLESSGALGKELLKSGLRLWDSRGWYKQIEQPALKPFRTASGLVVSVPDDRCWNAPVPCTPNPSPTLELREPGNIRRGFRVRGAWAMQDWPFKSRPEFLQAWRESRSPQSLPNEH